MMCPERVKFGQHGGNAVEHAFDVHVYHRVPVGGFQRGQGRGGHQTCVEENHVHFAKCFFGKGDKGGVVFGLDHVGYAVNRLAARRFDLVGNGFELVFAPRAEHDFRAFFGKFERGGFADAAGRAGDDDDFVGDVLHGGLLGVGFQAAFCRFSRHVYSRRATICPRRMISVY